MLNINMSIEYQLYQQSFMNQVIIPIPARPNLTEITISQVDLNLNNIRLHPFFEDINACKKTHGAFKRFKDMKHRKNKKDNFEDDEFNNSVGQKTKIVYKLKIKKIDEIDSLKEGWLDAFREGVSRHYDPNSAPLYQKSEDDTNGERNTMVLWSQRTEKVVRQEDHEIVVEDKLPEPMAEEQSIMVAQEGMEDDAFIILKKVRKSKNNKNSTKCTSKTKNIKKNNKNQNPEKKVKSISQTHKDQRIDSPIETTSGKSSKPQQLPTQGYQLKQPLKNKQMEMISLSKLIQSIEYQFDSSDDEMIDQQYDLDVKRSSGQIFI